ncbi:hypothetical protein [Tamlana crocina]|uniref:Lipoprotein n=1 Tax=Tamlana crocina TaxID=393006 RepID=A0ABX1D9J0_9FLAO|nr:hypothetical protein [Tamlana crocina]NJX15011.1 hypothetical protein [Tamlana crocina]
MRKLIVPILAMVFMACEETEKAKDSIDAVAAREALTEYATVNKVFQDVGNNSGDAVLTAENSNEAKTGKSETDGPTITVDPMDFTTFPKTITIDYGDGVLCKDGVTRKGIITVVSTGWYREEGSVHTSTFSNYYHEDFKVEGTHVVTNLGTNEDENPEYSVVINNGKITTLTGASINYTENSTRTWVAGADTPFNIWDDEYTLDGSQSGVSSKGVEYTLTVEEELHFVLLPRGIESGILDVSVGNIDDIKINYTNSTITIFGQTFPFGE